MNFTAEQIASMMAALSGVNHERKRALLPRMLEEWGRVDLEEHLTRTTPKDIRKERKLLNVVAKYSRQLASTIADLDSTVQFALATRLTQLEAGIEIDAEPASASLDYDEVRKLAKHLAGEPARLEQLARGANSVASYWQPVPLRHDTLIRYLVLQDLASIFEYSTGEIAQRRVRGEDHPQAGQEYGPFFDFVCAVWGIVFGSLTGLKAALKRWAQARQKYGERSAAVANMHLRHPEWQVYRW